MQITRREAKSTKQMLRVAPASMVTIMANTCLGSALPGRRRLGQSPHLATAPRGTSKEFSPGDQPGTRERGSSGGRVWNQGFVERVAREELAAKGRF